MTGETLSLSPRQWLAQLRKGIDHAAILAAVEEDAHGTGRYIFLVLIACGIAMLGLLLSSPAVVIGAMLPSPLMGPIVGLGFALAVFDLAAMRRARWAVMCR